MKAQHANVFVAKKSINWNFPRRYINLISGVLRFWRLPQAEMKIARFRFYVEVLWCCICVKKKPGANPRFLWGAIPRWGGHRSTNKELVAQWWNFRPRPKSSLRYESLDFCVVLLFHTPDTRQDLWIFAFSCNWCNRVGKGRWKSGWSDLDKEVREAEVFGACKAVCLF